MRDVTAFISAGGRGTRLSRLFAPDPTRGVTKALLRLEPGGRTLVEHHVESLLAAGPANIVVGAGDHPHLIEYVDRVYAEESSVSAVGTPVQRGNGGELLSAIRDFPERFAPDIVLVNVDTLLELPLQELVDAHRHHRGDLTFALTALPGVPHENAFSVGSDGVILHDAELDRNVMTASQARSRARYRASSTGAMALSAGFLRGIDWRPADGQLSLYNGIVGAAVRSRNAYAYHNGRRAFLDVGTTETWRRATDNAVPIESRLRYV